ncbi:MAG: sigma-70 family RNA polymerase sigma factor [Acidobacteriota bacterium]
MDEPPSERPDVAALYAQYRPLLFLIARRRFDVATEDAEELVHDVFVSYLRRWKVVREVRHWLIGAICHACRHRARKFGRLEQFDLDAHDISSPPPQVDRPVAQQLVANLSPRDQAILQLRYTEGLTSAEIGVLLGCSPKAADNRLRRALKHAAVPPRRPKQRK